MKITLFPFLYERECRPHISAYVSGDVITINGTDFDFSPIPEGYRLPAVAVDSNLFVKGSAHYIERKEGEIHLTIFLPVEWDSPVEARSPSVPTVISIAEGPVEFPDATPPSPPPVDFTPPTVEDFNLAMEAMKR